MCSHSKLSASPNAGVYLSCFYKVDAECIETQRTKTNEKKGSKSVVVLSGNMEFYT